MEKAHSRLRVAFIVGTLRQGGAEKQLVYMAQALHRAGVEVRIYSLTQGEHYESALRAEGIPICWFGRIGSPVVRLGALSRQLRAFHPHILQASHFFMNLYSSLAGRLHGALDIGSLRSDLVHEFEILGAWGPVLLRLPSVILANAEAAKRNAAGSSKAPDKIFIVANAIDIADFDRRAAQSVPSLSAPGEIIVVAAGTLLPVKRFDLFLSALALARRECAQLKGVLIGDGPEMSALQERACALGLIPDGLTFLGRRNEIPALLRQAAMLLLTSDHEGFPNVILEAMAARLPIIATPAGDVGAIVQNEATGYVVPFNDTGAMARRMVELAHAPALRRQFGVAGRARVEQCYSFEDLADRLLASYRAMALKQNRAALLSLLGK